MDETGFDAQITFICVADIVRSTEFYGDLLGLALARDQGPCRIYRAGDDAYLGICDHCEPDPGNVILTLVTDEVDAWAARLVEAGLDVDGPRANDRFEIYHCFLRDPDGHLVEIQRFDVPL